MIGTGPAGEDAAARTEPTASLTGWRLKKRPGRDVAHLCQRGGSHVGGHAFVPLAGRKFHGQVLETWTMESHDRSSHGQRSHMPDRLCEPNGVTCLPDCAIQFMDQGHGEPPSHGGDQGGKPRSKKGRRTTRADHDNHQGLNHSI